MMAQSCMCPGSCGGCRRNGNDRGDVMPQGDICWSLPDSTFFKRPREA